MRLVSPQVVLFPETTKYFVLPQDKEIWNNVMTLRGLLETFVEERRQQIKDGTASDFGDLLAILLTDDLFKNNNKMIIDECLTFFFAATQTSSMSTQNMLFYLTQQPKYRERVREEIQTQIIDKLESKDELKQKGLENVLDFENIAHLKFYSSCFMESLRIEPPVMYSSPCCLTEDQYIGKYHILKGEQIQMDMTFLHRNREQWQRPDEYLPDRFDPEHPLFLTPSGKKRHGMSFGPFLGGKRICLGKTFVETMSKIISPTLIHNFNFEFIDPKH